MLPEVRDYLENVRSHLHLDPVTEKRVISEFYSYFQERIDELNQSGLSERDATEAAIESFGRARVVARLMYEAHSKGSWVEAAITSTPHLIMAALFILHLWRHPILAPIAFISIVCVTLFGWWHGKPNWLYSWVGYSFLPLVIGGYASYPALERMASFLFSGRESLPGIWLLLFIFALLAFSVWIIIRTTVRVTRRDWILASLMLVPLPIFSSLLFSVEQLGGLFQSNGALLHQWDAPTAYSLLLLAVTSATFIRLRQRVLKFAALVALGSIALTMIGYSLWGGFGFFGFLALSICMLIFLLIPALVEAKLGHGEQSRELWWSGDWIHHPSTVR